MKIRKKSLKCVCFSALLLLPVLSQAEDQDSDPVDETGHTHNAVGSVDLANMSVDDIARELSNPVTALASFNTDIQYRTYQADLFGADDQSGFRFEFKPSIPISLSWKLQQIFQPAGNNGYWVRKLPLARALIGASLVPG
jgi:hypothetical protein